MFDVERMFAYRAWSLQFPSCYEGSFMGFGWSFYGFFVAAAGVAGALLRVGGARGPPRSAAGPADDRRPVGAARSSRSPTSPSCSACRCGATAGPPPKRSSSPPGAPIGPWVGGAVLAATQISAGTFVGTLGRHYLTGVSWTWIWFGVWAGWLLSAIFVAPKLRRFGALTVADYVGTRFASEGARTLAAALIIVSYTILLTAQFQAIGEIASAVFGIAPMVAMAALLASTGFYTALGGVRSSSYIEFMQTLIMVLALVCAVPVVLSHVGGLTALGEYVGSIEPRVTGWWFSWKRTARVRHRLRLRHRRRALRDDALLLDARRGRRCATPSASRWRLQVLIGSSVMILGIGMRGIYPVPAVAGSGVEHHGRHGDVAAARRAVPGRDAVGDHVDRQLDPAGHRRRLRARPLQAAGQPGGLAARGWSGSTGCRSSCSAWCRSGSPRCSSATSRPSSSSRRSSSPASSSCRSSLGLNWRRGTKEGAICEHGGRLRRLPGVDLHPAAQLRVARHRLGGGRRGG